jgi:hypothetical protein
MHQQQQMQQRHEMMQMQFQQQIQQQHLQAGMGLAFQGQMPMMKMPMQVIDQLPASDAGLRYLFRTQSIFCWRVYACLRTPVI